MHCKYLIIGAGLSGLTTANELYSKGEKEVMLLEGRSRTGGRIFTDKYIDLGATWFQSHHENVSSSLQKMGIPSFNQYKKGQSVLVYNTMAPAHYFESGHHGPSAKRIKGGSHSLIDFLTQKVQENIRLNTKVLQLREQGEKIVVHTTKGTYSATKVVVTVPPKLAAALHCTPDLPSDFIAVMQKTHTWMSNAIKIGLEYDRPFWRKKHLSGTLIGQVGPVIELYDHCNYDHTVFSLMGFINEGLRDATPEDRKERILAYLEEHLGKEVRNFKRYREKDWSRDRFTSNTELKSVYMSPQYGNPLFQTFQMNGKLLFSGTETSLVYGGYMDGAISSGLNAARLLLAKDLQ